MLHLNFPLFLFRHVECTGFPFFSQERKHVAQSSCIQQYNKIIIHLKTRNVPRSFSVIQYAKIYIIKRVGYCLMVKYIKKSQANQE